MKRTGEVTLSTIGLALSLFATIIVTVALFFSNSDVFRETFEDGFIEGSMEEGIAVQPGDAQIFLNFLLGMGWIAFGVLLISTILGIIAVYFFVGNKKPVAASVIAIITAIIVTIGTAFVGILPGILFLIAGIMGLVRKPPITDDSHIAETNLDWDPNQPDNKL